MGKNCFSFKRENQQDKLNMGVRGEEKFQNDSQVSDMGGWLNGNKSNQIKNRGETLGGREKGNLYVG